MKIYHIGLVILLAGFTFFTYQNSKYVVTDNDQVVVTQFGEVVGKGITVPGEYFKIPFIQKTHYFKKYVYASESIQQIPTIDKRFIQVKSKSFWKISDPVTYYKSINSYNLAKEFVLDHTGASERNVITSFKLSDIISNNERKDFKDIACKPKIEFKIKEMAKPLIAGKGLKLLNLEIKISSINNL